MVSTLSLLSILLIIAWSTSLSTARLERTNTVQKPDDNAKTTDDDDDDDDDDTYYGDGDDKNDNDGGFGTTHVSAECSAEITRIRNHVGPVGRDDFSESDCGDVGGIVLRARAKGSCERDGVAVEVPEKICAGRSCDLGGMESLFNADLRERSFDFCTIEIRRH